MTKIVKFRHIAVIVSILIIVIGMAVGTVCHFVSDGFFNYGDEFSSYKSIEVTTSAIEDLSGDAVQQIAEDELSSLGAYEVSFSLASGTVPNTVIYKFSVSLSDSQISSAVSSIEARFEAEGMEDATVVSHYNEGLSGGIWQLNWAVVALASAVVFQAIYFAIRLKPGMAISAICSQLAVVGVYASLLAITRCSVGLEAVAFAALAVIITMICNGVFFNRVKNSFKDEANDKAEKLDLVAEGARSTSKINAFVCIAAAIMTVIFAIFAMIASPSVVTLLPYVACLISIVACAYTFCVFAPANYAQLCGMDRRKK